MEPGKASHSGWYRPLARRRRLTGGAERLQWVAGSTDRRNTLGEPLGWGLIEQGLSGPFVELTGDGAELGLALQGQVGSVGKILAQQPVGVLVEPRCQGDLGSQK